MEIQVLKHVPFEGPAAIEEWARANGHRLTFRPVYEHAVLPAPERTEALLVLGGPMGVHDEDRYAWLTAEKRYIEAVMRTGAPVLGVCLGAQLLADVLGARVTRATAAEIGWYPVHFTEEARRHRLFEDFPATLTVMHWHGDTFECPAGMRRVGRTAGCPEQGFIDEDGRLAGLQFHMEWDFETAQRLVTACADELDSDSPFVQSKEAILDADAPFTAAHRHLFRFLDRFFG